MGDNEPKKPESDMEDERCLSLDPNSEAQYPVSTDEESSAESNSNHAARKAGKSGYTNSSRPQFSMGTKRFRCSLCTLSFALPRVLETHKMIEHQLEPKWKCQECGMPFLHGNTYSTHMATSHSVDQPHACDVCDQVFARSSELKAHRKVHIVSVKNQIYKCEFCPAEYPHLSKLKYHRRRHTGEKPFKCSQCELAFATSSQRLNHINRSHRMIRKHLCDHCGKKFCGPRELREHYRTHTGERPYQCPVCSRAFTKSNAMNVHLRQHTGEKPYVCDQCGQAFTVRVSLRTHLKNKHNIMDGAGIKMSGSVSLVSGNKSTASAVFVTKHRVPHPSNQDCGAGHIPQLAGHIPQLAAHTPEAAWRQRGAAGRIQTADSESSNDDHHSHLVSGFVSEWPTARPGRLSASGMGQHLFRNSQIVPVASPDPLNEPTDLRYHDPRVVMY